jgi:pyridinium-3,5-biscarboxylic acid mononucleotide synthase
MALTPRFIVLLFACGRSPAEHLNRQPDATAAPQTLYNPLVHSDRLRELLTAVSAGDTTVDEALARLKRLPFERLPFATVDHHRALRCGHPEVIYCAGKPTAQVVEIARRLAADGGCVLATRASAEQTAALRQAFGPAASVNEIGRCILVNPPANPEAREGEPHVALLSAGTSDAPVAEEAATTLRSMRAPVKRLTDVGVSGLHRLLNQLDVLQGACAVIVVAGMEGALPSVVGGLVACPVFAVPTSVGYGASLGGLAALLGMLNSCASNVSVVNIDNGFGAAFSASLVYQQVVKGKANEK